MDENQLRSTMSMVRIPVCPLPPETEMRAEDHRAMTFVSFAGVQSRTPAFDDWCGDCQGENDGPDRRQQGWCYDGCNDGPPCVHCTVSGQPDNVPCRLRQPSGNDVPLCEGMLAVVPPVESHYPAEPAVRLRYQSGYCDAEGSDAEFETLSGDASDYEYAVHRYLLRSPMKMRWHPCVDYYQYFGDCRPWWVCQFFTMNEGGVGGWRMYCNAPVPATTCGGTIPPQSDWRNHEFTPSILTAERAPMLATWNVGRHRCRYTEEMFCKVSGCAVEWWTCVDKIRLDAAMDTRTALANIYLICDVGLSDQVARGQRYPHNHPDTIAVKRRCWAEVNAHFAGLFATDRATVVGSLGPYDAGGVSMYSMGVDLGNRVVRDEAGSPLAITLYDPRRGLSIPAQLHLSQITGMFSVNSFARRLLPGDPPARRLYAAAHLRLEVRPFITPAGYAALADAGFAWLDPTDPYNYEVAHPDGSNQEHPYIRLLPTGPDGGMCPPCMSWHGLKAVRPYAVDANPYRVRRCANGSVDAGNPCCEFLHELNRLVIHGECNDHGNPDGAQRYTGSVGFRVRSLVPENPGVTFNCKCRA